MGASQGHSSAVRTTLGHYEYELGFHGTPFCIANISVPLNHTEKALYLKFIYVFQFSEEKSGLENVFLVPEISNKYKR